MLSIILPIACSGAQLESVVRRLIHENKEFMRRVPCELIFVDSIPNPGHKDEITKFNDIAPDRNVSFRYLETNTVGCHAKFREGLEIAIGEYALFLVDELIPIYNFLEDAYEIARKWDICPVPYLQTSAVEGSSYPLQYSKYSPVMPVSFPMLRRELFMELSRGIPSHSMGTLHWSTLCAEMGLKVVFASRHLSYCPLIKIDAVRPEVYLPIGRDVLFGNRAQFAKTWPLERCVQANQSMVKMCKSVLAENSGNLQVITGPKGGLYLTHQTGDVPLKNSYHALFSLEDIDKENANLIQEWDHIRKTDPKVSGLFEPETKVERKSLWDWGKKKIKKMVR